MSLNDSITIKQIIQELSQYSILWIDTEIADWKTKNPQLSLIQVLTDPKAASVKAVYVLDVLKQPELIALFIDQVMRDEKIEKVFHNASFDLRYLGKEKAKNITCTYKLAQKISKQYLRTSNLKLKTLAVELCNFSENEVDTQQQSSNWKQRPLDAKQLDYAAMDVIYLAHVHHYLLNFQPMTQTNFSKFSVTDVRVAFECPRLFYLSKHFGGKTLFIPSDQPKGIGQPFHKFAFKFIEFAKTDPEFKEIFKPKPHQLESETVAYKMQRRFYDQIFFQGLQKVAQSKPENVPILQQIWEGLRGLIQHWARLLIRNRYYVNYHNVISQTFVSQEVAVSCDYPLPNQKMQKIEGKFDSLIRDLEKNRLCMVEYKTYAPLDPSAQLAQVALYSYILHLNKQERVDSAVYCVLPEFKSYFYTWEQLKDTVHELTPLKLQQMRDWLSWKPSQPDPPPETHQTEQLCPICPQQETCQTYFKTDSSQPQKQTIELSHKEEKPKLKKEKINKEAENLGQQLAEILQAYGVNADYQGATVSASFIRIRLKPQLGVKVVSILNRATDMQVQMGLSSPPLISPQAGYISVDLPRSRREIVQFNDYIEASNNHSDIKIAMGVDLDSNLVDADLSDPNSCHFLVGGTTGSGKSEFLKSLVLSLIRRYPKEVVKIVLIDPKRVTFPEFENSPWLMSPVIKERDRAIQFMEQLVSEMEQRYQQFEQAQCSDLKSYNHKLIEKEKTPVPHIICVFDEYADFMVEKDDREALEYSIKRLGAMARAAGIHLIISTQRPEAKIVTPIIRSNLPGRVALKTSTEADSKIILGGNQTQAAHLLGKGDLLYLSSGQLMRLQSLLI
ncbi:cell division FtsK/SpoIIIE [Halothece sp. PCC 7418]|uniref:DNA translocase FtsK n=1 Tax=Halothece sp. (strain PCC 7418) TaxID=65093 RepID=UPI0002A067BF|nr:DNA translocase FtsK [Halothece sp. PCC 7418]AFZ43586.1 cell division FtsK/SpoIIIE [Halothece sp. PCC 7418]